MPSEWRFPGGKIVALMCDLDLESAKLSHGFCTLVKFNENRSKDSGDMEKTLLIHLKHCTSKYLNGDDIT